MNISNEDRADIYAQLLELAMSSPIITPPKPLEASGPIIAAVEVNRLSSIESDIQVTDSLGIDVLGERPNREIVVFSQGKTDVIPSVSKLTIPDLYQIAGPSIRGRIFLGDEATSPDGYHLNRVKDALAMQAGQHRLHDQTTRGAGCWLSHGQLILVGSREAAVWDIKEQQLSRITRPKSAGVLLDLDSGQPWYDFGRLVADIDRAADSKWRVAALDELSGLLALWRWQSGSTTSTLLAGAVLATWIQTAWRWRPHVAITAESGSGKSEFLAALKGLFGPLTLLNNRPTEAGLRQSIRNRACTVLIDEFESDSHRQRVLDLLRTSGTGSTILRGTPGQGGLEFGMRHICWVAATEVGLDRQPDRNRYLAFEMLMPPPDAQQTFRLPSDEDLADLGCRLLAITVRMTGPAMTLAAQLRSHPIEGFDIRTVESLAVPAAMLAVTMGQDSPAAAREVLEFCATCLSHDQAHQESDQVDLMHAILASTVSLERGQQASVAQLLSRPSSFTSDALDALERVGVAIASDSNASRGHAVLLGPSGLFLDTRTIRRYLLSGTRWVEQSIDTILLRLPSAKRRRRRLAGHRVYGIELDWSWFDEHFLGEDEDESREPAKADF